MPAFNLAGIAAWILGFIVYKLAAPIGATFPALGTSIVVYGTYPLARSDEAPLVCYTEFTLM